MQHYHLSSESSNPQMSIQGQLLEVTVVGCTKLKDTEWISRQDPYVCLEYGSTKFRTRTCTDGGKNPTFQEKFVFTLIEGLRELNLAVWNSNTLTYDDFIGSGKVQLHKALSQGFDDTTWPLQTKTGRYAGEARVILHYANAIVKTGNELCTICTAICSFFSSSSCVYVLRTSSPISSSLRCIRYSIPCDCSCIPIVCTESSGISIASTKSSSIPTTTIFFPSTISLSSSSISSAACGLSSAFISTTSRPSRSLSRALPSTTLLIESFCWTKH
ncbi:hypothetical protein EUGRSUZ_I01113 [Eucalyptus grandis]|uniref:Uncharacterized protein n=2 Tax=Eucalyptus grandis TaxID=71139 RepID=A0ACC3JF60_EUCGR|nr:hypothetical protein EUGRSUZ_I01113 [Eucalyptus grandis]